MKEIAEVRIKVGELQAVDSEIFEFALEQVKTHKFKNAEFKIEETGATLQCRSCGNKWCFSKEKLDQNVAEAIHFVPEIVHSYIQCQRCGSPDFAIVEGRGVWLESIRGVK